MSVAPHDGHATSAADGNSAEHHMQRGSGADAPVIASSSMPDTLARRQDRGIPRWYLGRMASPSSAFDLRARDAAPRGGYRYTMPSLPLDRGWRLRRDVIDHAVHAGHLVHDPARDLREDLVWQLRPVGRHPVLGGHRPNGDDVRIRSAVAHDAHGPNRRQDRERLPQRPVQTGALDLVDDDPIGLAQRVESLGSDLADDPDREAGAGERLEEDDRLRESHLEPDRAYLVLEQVAQRLDQLEPQVGRQAADVVMGLDLLGGLRLGRRAFDHIRVERPLGEELDLPGIALDLGRLFLEHADELVADDLAFLLWVLDAR